MQTWFNRLTNFYSKKTSLVYFLVLLLAILDRVNCYLRFARVYTDSDQTLQWLITKDLLNGLFFGPCFYGQSYNPIIEPAIAVPLVSCGLDFSDALPLVTTILGATPMLLISIYLFLKGNKKLAFIPLFISLLLSVEYQMLTSISRGFVTGVFLWITGIAVTHHYSSRQAKTFGGFLLGLGVFANPK